MAPHVLMVEDSPTQRAALVRLFGDLGWPVAASVQTEAEACLWLDENDTGWGVAVVDLVLEQGTGMGVISRCRARPSSAKVVVLSDYATPGIRKHCLKLGADAVFQKGTEFAAFAQFLREL
ncbi:MAG: response regulator [Ramlibacter sp.]|nr:response regulator [Ramlibacter sp.]